MCSPEKKYAAILDEAWMVHDWQARIVRDILHDNPLLRYIPPTMSYGGRWRVRQRMRLLALREKLALKLAPWLETGGPWY